MAAGGTSSEEDAGVLGDSADRLHVEPAQIGAGWSVGWWLWRPNTMNVIP